jgi:transcriptional regulator with XRE-family HTH domain
VGPMTRTPELAEFGRGLRLLREARGVSVVDLADAAALTQSRLEAIEAGRYDLRYDALVALARGLGLTLAEMVVCIEAIVRA